jgi:hydrogenase large subunit
MATITLDPVTRLEGHLKIAVTVDALNNVTSAEVAGNLYRGFENMLVGRIPKDAAFLTQRVCGVCPVSHAIASVKAVEKALNFTPNLQAILLRNLIQGSNFIASNILHFYHLALMDYIEGPAMSPWAPSYSQDLRFSAADSQSLLNNYLTALKIRRNAQEMAAIFSGKLPHVTDVVPGGVTALPTTTDIANFQNLFSQVQAFIVNNYQADVNKLASVYSDYYNIGQGYGNLICFGVFDTPASGNPLFPSGVMTGGTITAFNPANIKEDVGSSWYSSASGLAPANGVTTPSPDKTNAYSWLKAPRYNNLPYEAGPLARVWMSGDWRRGVSVMDRHIARYVETAKIASNMQSWLGQITPGASGYTNVATPASGSGVGFTEAPRGALGHWLTVASSQISRYQIITPTCWNGSPKDDAGNFGPIEKALIGVHVADLSKPVELLRVVHSYDPCTACAVHVLSPEGEEMSKFVVQPGV